MHNISNIWKIERHQGYKQKREYCTDLLCKIYRLVFLFNKKNLSAFVKLLTVICIINKYYIRRYVT